MTNIIHPLKDILKQLYYHAIDCTSWIQPSGHDQIVKKRIASVLIHTFSGDEGQRTNMQTGELGYGLIHYAFIQNNKPKRILCIGSRKGYIPAVCALACKSNGLGHVDFVDPGYGKSDVGKNWSGVGFWKKNDPGAHFQKLGLHSWITTHVTTSREFSKQHKSRIYDYVYIDGNHSYEGIKTDYQLFWPKLKSGGFMVLHDVVAKGTLDGGVFGVHKFWKELNHKHTILFPLPRVSGLGIIQK